MAAKRGSKIYYPGRKEMMKCGQFATILEYIDRDHIRIQFEDGFIRETNTTQFKRGEVRNSGLKFKYDVGDTNVACNGQLMTIIERKDRDNILIRFEDGTERWTSSQSFKLGRVKNPNLNRSIYLGRQIFKDGHTATCIDTRNSKCLFEFDTGETRWVLMTQVKKGFLFPHEDRGDVIKAVRRKTVQKFIGEKCLNNQGLEMTIVDYHDANHCTVEFTDTGYRTVTKRQSFLVGQVEDKIATTNKYLSIRKMQRCGLWAQIVEYTPEDKNPKCKMPAKYVIEFEDGVRFENSMMHEFLHGELKHPKRPMVAGSVINNVKIFRKKFNLGTEPQMRCQCQNCGWEDIASFDEIWAHVCDLVI